MVCSLSTMTMTASAAYSINDLETLTGIKAHTIRMWEKRYGIPEPERTDTNIRLYSDRDLRYLLNVAILRKKGHKISEIAGLHPEEMKRLVINGSARNQSDERIEQMILAMLNLDEDHFRQLLTRSIMDIGLEETFEKTIYPFFNRIGLMWQTGTIDPAQEHFVSNIVRQKLIVSINSLDGTLESTRKPFLVFLPQDEIHELGILFYTYLIRKQGYRVIYLGQSTPLSCVHHVAESQQPGAVLTSLITARPEGWIPEFLQSFCDTLPAEHILITGPQVFLHETEASRYPKLKLLRGAEELKSWLQHFQAEVV